MAVSMKMAAFWVAAPCKLVYVYLEITTQKTAIFMLIKYYNLTLCSDIKVVHFKQRKTCCKKYTFSTICTDYRNASILPQ
jgi:hypothetical protein